MDGHLVRRSVRLESVEDIRQVVWEKLLGNVNFNPVSALTSATVEEILGCLLGGAFAPMIAQALQSSTGTVYSVAWYLVALTVVGLVVAVLMKDRTGAPLSDSEEAVQRDTAPLAP